MLRLRDGAVRALTRTVDRPGHDYAATSTTATVEVGTGGE